MSAEKIIVIGAGASGLTCARELQKKGYDVQVLEAADTIGGRIATLKGFLSWKDLDLGAEFIHGDDNILMDTVNEFGIPARLMFTWAQGDGELPPFPVNGGMSMYYLGREKLLLRYDTNDTRVTDVNKVLWELGELSERSPTCKKTLEEHLKEHGIGETGLSLAEAGYSNTICTESKKVSLKAIISLEKSWELNGDGDFRVETGMFSVFERMARDLKVRCNFVVKNINYGGDLVEIVSNKGEKVFANRVVVSASLGALKAELIRFNPPLPDPKIQAIKLIEFAPATKLVFKFSQRFWPKELQGVICSHSFIPELWFDGPERVGARTPWSSPVYPTNLNNNNEPPTYLVSGFCTSRNADYVAKLTDKEIIEKGLKQLDEMFSGKEIDEILRDNRVPLKEPPHQLKGQKNGDKPASAFFMEFLKMEWGKHEFALGGYSSPTIGETPETRDALAAPINNKVFFCGEHTNRSYMTINSAMASGKHAAERIMELGGNKKSLSKL